MACGAHIRDASAVNDKGSDVPGHYKHAHSPAHEEHTDKAGAAHILGRKEKRCCAKMGCKVSPNCKQNNNPECQQYLVLAEMKDHQLHRQKVIDTPD